MNAKNGQKECEDAATKMAVQTIAYGWKRSAVARSRQRPPRVERNEMERLHQCMKASGLKNEGGRVKISAN